MGHRHLYNGSNMFDSEHDQNWNNMQPEQNYGNPARAGPAENSSLFYPAENMAVDGAHGSSHWIPVPMANGYICLNHNVAAPHFQSDVSGPPHDRFMHPPIPGAFCAIPENYAHNASSSTYDRQTTQGIEGGFIDLTMGSTRGPCKRKSPAIPSICERGSSSRYHGAGSSSDIPMSSEMQQERPSVDYQNMPWDCATMPPPSYRGNGLSIRGEGSMRNVRSRPALELEPNIGRTHLAINPPQNPYATNHVIEHSTTIDPAGQNSSALPNEWSHNGTSPSETNMFSEISSFAFEEDQFPVGSSSTNIPAEFGRHHQDFGVVRNPVVPPGFHSVSSTPPLRVPRSGFSQRSNPYFSGSSSSSVRLDHMSPPLDHMSHPRSFSNAPWRNSDRHGRSRVFNERYWLMHPDVGGLHDRFASEGFMVVERAGIYGSRNILDQHRDMRLDVDNMTYEELLALGESIGSVSTGLSEDEMSKSLRKTIYCSSDQIQEEEACVICLEEYKDMDDVETLKACSHNYHASCIRKWLSMKKVCPICKASALPDNNNKEE
ncbi:hypothetical protein ACFE04_000958 [Oxalis oulophora]